MPGVSRGGQVFKYSVTSLADGSIKSNLLARASRKLIPPLMAIRVLLSGTKKEEKKRGYLGCK